MEVVFVEFAEPALERQSSISAAQSKKANVAIISIEDSDECVTIAYLGFGILAQLSRTQHRKDAADFGCRRSRKWRWSNLM